MKSRTKQILATLHILCWIIFIGLCIKTGAILYSAFVSIAINPGAAKNIYLGLDLAELYNFGIPNYIALVSLVIVTTALKAYIFYVAIRIFLKINYSHPFSQPVAALITKISYVALSIGILILAGNGYADWLTKNEVSFPPLNGHLGGGGEFIFFAGVIFFIAQVFKKGIEIQTENELTV